MIREYKKELKKTGKSSDNVPDRDDKQPTSEEMWYYVEIKVKVCE